MLRELAYAGHTTLHPVGLGALLLCVGAIFLVKREWAVLPLIALLAFVPVAQRIVVGGLDFDFTRIAVIAALLRALVRRDGRMDKMTTTDVAVLLWMVWSVAAFGILQDSLQASITRTGFMLQAVGSYFFGRMYVGTLADIRRMTIFMGVAAIPVLGAFIAERLTGRNPFSEFGGVPAFTVIRDGRFRCQGPFPHPIMAGVFWASMLPWLTALWMSKAARKSIIMVFVLCVAGIVVLTASSTPIMSVLFALIGFSLFPLRRNLNVVRWGTVVMLIILHFAREKPVWHLLARIDVVSGSTGWHRYYLIDKFIEHYDEWLLIGTRSTNHWGHGLYDVTNQFVLEGVRGGLLGLALFVFILVAAFIVIGKAMRQSRSRTELWFMWSSGVVLFVHVMNFQAVSYFGQAMSIMFVFLGATITVATAIAKRTPAATEPADTPVAEGHIHLPAARQ